MSWTILPDPFHTFPFLALHALHMAFDTWVFTYFPRVGV
jgi:hypothetical protein